MMDPISESYSPYVPPVSSEGPYAWAATAEAEPVWGSRHAAMVLAAVWDVAQRLRREYGTMPVALSLVAIAGLTPHERAQIALAARDAVAEIC